MDCGEVGEAVLVSIKPRFAEAILRGSKRVEFRKVRFRRDVSCLVLYASSPVCRIVGIIGVEELIHDSPEELWGRFANLSGLEESEYWDYFGERKSAVGIQISDVLPIKHEIFLEQILPGARPPQSFQYLPSEALVAALQFA